MRILPLLLLTWAAGAQAGHACVDLADATARRWVQDEPCKLPMVQAPPDGLRTFGEPAPRLVMPAPPAPAMAGHAMFWRFPVQGIGPHAVPRHSWR